jgi:hypothetical protein
LLNLALTRVLLLWQLKYGGGGKLTKGSSTLSLGLGSSSTPALLSPANFLIPLFLLPAGLILSISPVSSDRLVTTEIFFA